MLSYANCDTCKKALRWLTARGVAVDVRPIVEQPPTLEELQRWVPQSGLPVRKWLNSSGQSFRALGKEAVDAADEGTLLRWLAADGKLVKRPVLVLPAGRVLIGFQEDTYQAQVGGGVATRWPSRTSPCTRPGRTHCGPHIGAPPEEVAGLFSPYDDEES